MYQQNEWINRDGYRVRVNEVKEEIMPEGGSKSAESIRAVRIHVSYENRTEKTLKYVTLQWLLYDTDGYSYESGILRKLYGDDAVRKLQEGHLSPGKSVQGWIAFQLPKDARPDYVQFRSNYLAKSVADIVLDGKRHTLPKDERSVPSTEQTAKNDMITCPYCGVSQPDHRSYCLGCGAALPEKDNTEKGAVDKFLNTVRDIFDQRKS